MCVCVSCIYLYVRYTYENKVKRTTIVMFCSYVVCALKHIFLFLYKHGCVHQMYFQIIRK